ncbi:MAG: T9SS type A sorting domain-containing protein [Prevotellaceae bacterium]|jgi:PKD repeat protein|nr:T9SS type A sorting domain-containing protein [Prevotellaceae bacterium]
MKKYIFLIIIALCSWTYSTGQIRLTFDKEVGCRVVSEEDLKASLLFIEDISSSYCLMVCEGSTVTFSLENFGSTNALSNVVSTNWQATGGNILTSSLYSATVQWGNEQSGSLNVTIKMSDGTKKNRTYCVDIIPSPRGTIDILGGTKNNYRFCKETELYFSYNDENDESPAMNYLWVFDDGTFSSEQNPAHTYHEAGNYRVRLTVTNECNCSSEFIQIITILENRPVNILCPTLTCEGRTETYRAEKTECGLGWKVEGGRIVNAKDDFVTVEWIDSHYLSDNGYGILYYIDRCSPCQEWQAIKIPVLPLTATIKGDEVICIDEQTKFSLPQWATTDYQWSIIHGNPSSVDIVYGDQRNEVFLTLKMAMTVVLECVYTNTIENCGGRAEITITAQDKTNISGSDKLCKNSSAVYSLSSYNGGRVKWFDITGNDETLLNGNAGTVNVVFDTPGIHIIRAEVDGQCNPDPFIVNVYSIDTLPQVTIDGLDEVCPNVPVPYTIVGTVPSNMVAVWSVTNGAITGTNRGSMVNIVFDGNSSNYTISVHFELLAEPHCLSSESITFNVVKKNFDNISIVNLSSSDPADFNFCSSTVSHIAGNIPYEYESVQWQLYPNYLGNISSTEHYYINVGMDVNIAWNNVAANSTGVIIMIVRMCEQYDTIVQVVNLNPVPVLSWTNVPTETCSGVPFNVTLNSSMNLSGATIVWSAGGRTIATTQPADGNAFTQALTLSNLTNTNMTQTITAKVFNGNVCNLVDAFTTITVKPQPDINVDFPHISSFCTAADIDVTLHATVQNSLTITLPNGIKWYKNGNIVGIGTSLTVSDFGTYYAVATSQNGCSTQSRYIYITQMQCGGGTSGGNCPPAPTDHITADITECNTIGVTVQNLYASSYWEYDIDNISISSSNGNTFNFTASEPGRYFFTYHYSYETGCWGATTLEDVIVPYKAVLRYEVTCNESEYLVTLYNDSPFVPGFEPDNVIFSLPGGTIISTNGTTSITYSLLPGTYHAKMEISIAGSTLFQPCTKEFDIVLEDLPAPTFTLENNSACPENPIYLRPNVINPNSTYLWTIKDQVDNEFATNSLTEFDFMPGLTNSDYRITLTETNQYGCSATSAYQQVHIYDNGIPGRVRVESSSSFTECAGNSILLSVSSIPNNILGSYYQWMNGSKELAGENSSSVAVTTTGSYWARLTTVYGCQNNTLPAVNVLFTPVPEVRIDAPTGICQGSEATLQGYIIGDIANIEYRWTKGSVVLKPWTSGSNPANLSITVSTAGTYTLEVKDLVSNCTNSASHTLTVSSTPAAPTLSYRFLSRSPYTVEITASHPDNGAFTWSNGMNGATVVVTSGGAYQVRFTSEFGCDITTSIDVPRHPDEYMWIFPKGCYTFCDGDNIRILGPSENNIFSYYAWLWNYHPDQWEYNNIVSDYYIYRDGTYNLELEIEDQTGNRISSTSGNMDVQFIKCPDCDIKAQLFVQEKVEKTYIYYIIQLDVYNNSPYDLSLDFSSYFSPADGYYVPSGGTVTAGNTASFILQFIPFNPDLRSTIIRIDGANAKNYKYHCTYNIQYELIRGARANGPYHVPAHKPTEQSVNESAVIFGVMPNPAREQIDINYLLEDKSAAEVYIYDMQGKKLWTGSNQNGAATHSVNISTWTQGYYIAVLRSNGQIIRQQIFAKQ